jgi:hypothetical protein
MHFNVCDIIYSKCFHKHVSAAIAAIFRVILLQEYKCTDLVNRVTISNNN